MNLLSKKTILKAYSILQLLILCLCYTALIVIVAVSLSLFHRFGLTITTEYFNTLILPIIIISAVYTVYFFTMAWYFKKKIRQNKEQFYKTIVLLRVISVICFLIDNIFAIIFLIAAFSKDDGLEERVREQKEKKQKKNKKPKYPKEIKKQIANLKAQRRRGIISQDKYEKEFKKIIKNMNNTENTTHNNTEN
ncbi:MAG: hypothetical protein J6Q51_01645 [Clostridia bacterium]|nr:hypothetical protein [Clostridia bacterium]